MVGSPERPGRRRGGVAQLVLHHGHALPVQQQLALGLPQLLFRSLQRLAQPGHLAQGRLQPGDVRRPRRRTAAAGPIVLLGQDPLHGRQPLDRVAVAMLELAAGLVGLAQAALQRVHLPGQRLVGAVEVRRRRRAVAAARFGRLAGGQRRLPLQPQQRPLHLGQPRAAGAVGLLDLRRVLAQAAELRLQRPTAWRPGRTANPPARPPGSTARPAPRAGGSPLVDGRRAASRYGRQRPGRQAGAGAARPGARTAGDRLRPLSASTCHCRSWRSASSPAMRSSRSDSADSRAASASSRRRISSRRRALGPSSPARRRRPGRRPAVIRDASAAISSRVRRVRSSTDSSASASALRSRSTSWSSSARDSPARRSRARSSSISSVWARETRSTPSALPSASASRRRRSATSRGFRGRRRGGRRTSRAGRASALDLDGDLHQGITQLDAVVGPATAR